MALYKECRKSYVDLTAVLMPISTFAGAFSQRDRQMGRQSIPSSCPGRWYSCHEACLEGPARLWLTTPSRAKQHASCSSDDTIESLMDLYSPAITQDVRRVFQRGKIWCQSHKDIELFEDDPSKYLHYKLNFYEEVPAPNVAATSFL
jgi:hypothetical protein